MIGAVIITHGALASGIVEVAQSITGPLEKVLTVEIMNSESTEAIRDALCAAVERADSGKGVIIFTDMFGGTPTNIALSLLDEGRVEIITGINLPILIKFVGHRSEKPLHELTLLLKDYGQKSIVLAGDMLKERK